MIRIIFITLLCGLFSPAIWAQPAPFVPARDPQVVAISPSGALVATGVSGLSDGQFPPRPHPDVRKCGVVFLWDAATGKRIRRMETYGDLTQLQFSPDGQLIAATRLFATHDGLPLPEVRIWNVASGQLVRGLDRCHAFAFSVDGTEIAVTSRKKCALFDVATWERELVYEPLGGALSVACTKDAILGIVKTDKGFAIRKCDKQSRQLIHESTAVPQPFYRLAIAPAGDLIATGHQGQVVLWNYATLEPLAQLPTKEPGLAHPFFSPDKTLLAAGCQANGDTIIWDLGSRQELRRFTLEKGKFRPFIARSEDEKIRPEIDPQRFVFAPDSKSVLTGAYGGILRQISDGRDIARFGE